MEGGRVSVRDVDSSARQIGVEEGGGEGGGEGGADRREGREGGRGDKCCERRKNKRNQIGV